MSSHSVKSRMRHPAPTTFTREPYPVQHILFEICDHPDNGATFSLIAGEATEAKFRRPLFTGFVHAGMAAQLRALADRCEELEAHIGCEKEGVA